MDLDLTDEITEIVDGETGSDATLMTALPSGSSSVRILMYQNYSPQDVGDDVDWSAYDFIARGLATALVNAKQNDSLIVAGVTYNIEDIYTTDDGWAVMPLTINN